MSENPSYNDAQREAMIKRCESLRAKALQDPTVVFMREHLEKIGCPMSKYCVVLAYSLRLCRLCATQRSPCHAHTLTGLACSCCDADDC